MTPPVDVDQAADRAADQLYGLPPADFTAARDELAASARTAGDRELASAIKALRKPTAAAWLVNLLVRRRRGEVESFVALGESLREATAAMSGADLRELSAQRHRVVQALVAQARVLGREHGARVGEDTLRGVEETLTASLSDPAAGDQVLSGRLTTTLSPSGFGAGSPATASPPRRSRGGTTARGRRGPDPDEAARVAAAGAAAREAAELRDRIVAEEAAAEEAVTAARRAEKDAGAEVVGLRDQLAAAEARHAQALTAVEEAVSSRKDAAARRRSAEAAADKARKAVSGQRSARSGH